MTPFTTDLGRIAGELPDALTILARDGEITWANTAAVDLLGLEPVDWIGRSVFDLLHPDDHAMAFQAFETVGEHKRGSLIDVRVKDGNEHWRQIELRGRYVHGATPEDDFIVVILRDVADRQHLELAGGDHNRLRALVHHSTALLLSLDADGRVLTANGELSRLLHHDLSCIAGRPMTDLVNPADRRRLRDALTTEGDGTSRLELLFDRPDGSTLTLDISITDLRRDPLVAGFVVSGTDITDLKMTQQALRHMADHDALTDLLSRRALLSRLDTIMEDGYQHEIVVLFCDLDGFKQVNDRIGHAAGDQVLVEVARRLERALRPGDLVGRLGGDEFVVVLPQADQATCDGVAERIRALLTAPILAGDELVEVDVSIGAATTGDYPTATRLLATADDAMYAVKQSRKRRAESLFELNRSRSGPIGSGGDSRRF